MLKISHFQQSMRLKHQEAFYHTNENGRKLGFLTTAMLVSKKGIKPIFGVQFYPSIESRWGDLKFLSNLMACSVRTRDSEVDCFCLKP